MLKSLDKLWVAGRRIALPLALFGAVCLVAIAFMSRSRIPARPHIVTVSRTVATPSPSEMHDRIFYSTIGNDPTSMSMPPNAPLASEVYTIEILATPNLDQAERAAATAQEQGRAVYITPAQRGRDVIYHVRSGVYRSQDVAKRDLDKMQSLGAEGTEHIEKL